MKFKFFAIVFSADDNEGKEFLRERMPAHSRRNTDYLASGSGRSWKCTI
jgi:hypothetical protein